METDYQKLYNNLTVLLQDICQFLSSDKLGSLSHRDKKLVESLITRSKVQLQEISKVEKLCVTEEYVDMDAKKVTEEDEEKPDIYSSVDDVNKNVETIIPEGPLCPYTELAAKEAYQTVKCGFMSMRRRFLLGFEKMKRVYGTIHNQWLLIYYTEKDARPICTFNLKNFEAKESDGPKSTNFELISTSNQKVYYFLALTPKDMLQWVVHINRCHDNVIVQSKGLDLENNDGSLEEDFGEHYDTVIPGSDNRTQDMEEEDDIYLELDDIIMPSQNNNAVPQKGSEYDSDIGPPLPGRRPQRGGLLIPVSPPLVKPATPLHVSEESLASYDDIRDLSKDSDQDSDVEDNTYEAFVHVKQNINKMSKPLSLQNRGELNERDDQVKTNEITRKYDSTEPKNELVANLKDKFQKYPVSNASTIDNSVSSTKIEKEDKNLFVQEITDKTNITPSPTFEPKIDIQEIKQKFRQSSSIDSKDVKGAGSLNPPVIPKVPVVPVKPKIRDKPSIGKRPPFSSFKQAIDR